VGAGSYSAASLTINAQGRITAAADILTTKGDLLVYGSSHTRLGAGSDGAMLVADSAQTLGLKYLLPSATLPLYYNASTGVHSIGGLSSLGKQTLIAHTEVQFSKDINFLKPIRFEIWASGSLSTYGDFNDALFDAGYGQYRMDYRHIRDFINISNEGKGFIPACGGLQQDVLVFPFNYIQAIMLKSSLGMMLRLISVDDQVMSSADMAAATLYIETMSEES